MVFVPLLVSFINKSSAFLILAIDNSTSIINSTLIFEVSPNLYIENI